MPTEEEIVKEFQAARDRYYDLMARVAPLKIPGGDGGTLTGTLTGLAARRQ